MDTEKLILEFVEHRAIANTKMKAFGIRIDECKTSISNLHKQLNNLEKEMCTREDMENALKRVARNNPSNGIRGKAITASYGAGGAVGLYGFVEAMKAVAEMFK